MIISINGDTPFSGRKAKVLEIYYGRELRQKGIVPRLLPENDDVLYVDCVVGDSNNREENQLTTVQLRYTNINDESINYLLWQKYLNERKAQGYSPYKQVLPKKNYRK